MRPILVFDSGLGGLSVLRALRRELPAQRFVYLADDSGFPYGAWDGKALERRVVEVVAGAVDRFAPTVAVIACNTASTIALPALRAALRLPIVGTVPAIKPAAARTRSGLVSVLATPGTIQREYTRDLIAQFAAGVEVTLHGAPRLAEIAEAFVRAEGLDLAAVREEIAACFVDGCGRRTDTIVLGCTHFPLILPKLIEAAPWPVEWIDPAPAIARRTAAVLAAESVDPAPRAATREPTIYLFTSGRPPGPVIDRADGVIDALPERSGTH